MTAGTLHGCTLVDVEGVCVLMDGRRRVGMIVDDGEGTHSAWVYVFDRPTGNTIARFVGRAQTREAAADRIQAARPARTSWS